MQYGKSNTRGISGIKNMVGVKGLHFVRGCRSEDKARIKDLHQDFQFEQLEEYIGYEYDRKINLIEEKHIVEGCGRG